MVFNERERFIFHVVTAMSLSTMGEKFDVKVVVEEVLKNRCRHMDSEMQKEIYKDLEQEMLEGGSMYEEMIAKLRDREGLSDLR